MFRKKYYLITQCQYVRRTKAFTYPCNVTYRDVIYLSYILKVSRMSIDKHEYT